ncbi:MAG: hypothetical protein R3E96_07600 [Planctomycetota bacterium]
MNTSTSGGLGSVEFAYLEKAFSPEVSFRAGLLLLPVGFTNELHEPTTYYGSSRPEIEQRILPTTWRENGLGVLGGTGDWTYKLYLVTSLDGEGFTASGLRGGRQKGSKSVSEDLALTGRLDWQPTDEWSAGVSLFHGGTAQDNAALGSMDTTLVDVHAQYQRGPWRLRALHAQARVGDTEELFNFNGRVVGERMVGTYLEAGYDVLAGRSGQSLIAFVRHEQLDTHDQVAGGLTRDPAQDESLWTFGLNWYPDEQIVFKIDYSDFDVAADRLQLSLGYVF